MDVVRECLADFAEASCLVAAHNAPRFSDGFGQFGDFSGSLRGRKLSGAFGKPQRRPADHSRRLGLPQLPGPVVEIDGGGNCFMQFRQQHGIIRQPRSQRHQIAPAALLGNLKHSGEDSGECRIVE